MLRQHPGSGDERSREVHLRLLRSIAHYQRRVRECARCRSQNEQRKSRRYSLRQYSATRHRTLVPVVAIVQIRRLTQQLRNRYCRDALPLETIEDRRQSLDGSRCLLRSSSRTHVMKEHDIAGSQAIKHSLHQALRSDWPTIKGTHRPEQRNHSRLTHRAEQIGCNQPNGRTKKTWATTQDMRERCGTSCQILSGWRRREHHPPIVTLAVVSHLMAALIHLADELGI